MVAVYLAIYFVAPDRSVDSLKVSEKVLKEMALPLLFTFVVMIVLNLFDTHAHISRFFGSRYEITSVFFSSVAGILSMGPVYAWLPNLAAIRE